MKIKFRKLIDLAIGSPEPGHVDFQALHYLLTCFAEQLDIIDQDVNYNKPPKQVTMWCAQRVPSSLFVKENMKCLSDRLSGGEDEPAPEDSAPPAAAEPAEETNADAAAADEPPPPPPDDEDAASDDFNAPLPDMPVPSPTGSVTHHSIENYEPAPVEGGAVPQKLKLGVSIMKDQLELAMEQLTIITDLLLDKDHDRKRFMGALNVLQNKLRNLQRQNIYIESAFHHDDAQSVSWHASGDVEEFIGELEEVKSKTSSRSKTPESLVIPPEPPAQPDICQNDFGLEPCIVYTADQLLDQFLELKSEFCQLLNKVNTIAATILEQDYHGLMSMAANLQADLEDVKLKCKELMVQLMNNNVKVQTCVSAVDVISSDMQVLKERCVLKEVFEQRLELKANIEELNTKVSKDELAEFQQEIELKFCEYRGIINTNERNVMKIIDNLRTSLGIDVLENMLFKLRDKEEEDVRLLSETLKHYIELTNDECASATARVKVLKDLKCLSCDTGCVMRQLERGKVAKLQTIHNNNSMVGPLVTYELSTIRKSGLMGYYRKSDMPNNPKAWLDRQEVPMQKCVPRQSGGDHTKISRKDFADKVMVKPKDKR